MANEGISNQYIAERLSVSRPTMIALRNAFAQSGLTAVTGVRRRNRSGLSVPVQKYINPAAENSIALKPQPGEAVRTLKQTLNVLFGGNFENAGKGVRLVAARRCCYCQQQFQPSPFRPQQKVCSQPACQRRRRSDYHRSKIQTDPEYRQVCPESQRKWRSQNPGYWRKYRERTRRRWKRIAANSATGTRRTGWPILPTTT